ncbi:Ax21 family protein [Pseudomarimonas arenosa]|uniref:Ax21 family protein n=1 Tax=Pseudomarimonas arenosa TaxID=2774145 RepID=A0AAW3ZLN9_9GAMM|nr:Ax21 family protein [Pseudomarimonas arenosa]MBD8527058.1 Ax21 family protein [Pseudomarimonas arenosa]
MRKTLFALALLALPLAANAGEISYNYGELGYSQLNIKGSSNDADGVAFNGSALLGDQFFIYGGHGRHETDIASVDLDLTRLGFGWRHGLSSSMDLVLNANYLRLDVDAGVFRGDVDGYEAEIGLRNSFGQRFETTVALGYTNGDNIDGDVYAKLSGHYKFNKNWGLVATATVAEGANEYLIGPRLRF